MYYRSEATGHAGEAQWTLICEWVNNGSLSPDTAVSLDGASWMSFSEAEERLGTTASPQREATYRPRAPLLQPAQTAREIRPMSSMPPKPHGVVRGKLEQRIIGVLFSVTVVIFIGLQFRSCKEDRVKEAAKLQKRDDIEMQGREAGYRFGVDTGENGTPKWGDTQMRNIAWGNAGPAIRESGSFEAYFRGFREAYKEGRGKGEYDRYRK